MPNKSCSLLIVSGKLFKRAISFLHLSSQRAVLFTEFVTYCLSATLDGHSSNAIAIVEPRFDCICMLSSGPIKILAPSICELKYTPSSFILRRPASENTWNPPESVRIGLSHTMNLCSPPRSLMILSPVLTCR